VATREATYGVRVIGARSTWFRDFYHAFLKLPWPLALGTLVVSYLALNAVFALLYLLVGGVASMREGSFMDAFFFSVQTMGTIGYGAMYPTSPAANAVVVLESVTGLIVTAVSTGLIFAKFSQSAARIGFTRQAVITLMDGEPTLMFRLGNERGNLIVEAHLRVTLVRTEHTAEGAMFYRMYDLALVRERSQALTRSWTAMHAIKPDSPLYGMSPELLKSREIELLVSVSGVDDTSLQLVHARHRYTDEDIVWGARHADILSETKEGEIIADLRKFHEIVPTVPTEKFPYPRPIQKSQEPPTTE
jgi:inward rectifier potassium channel